MHDLKQLAKDAERVEASAKAWLSEYDLDRDEIEYRAAERRLAAFARDLTDETPLTVELLVERGGKYVGDDAIRFGRISFTICEVEGVIGVMVGEEHLPRKMWPRTVGELTILLLMMEGR